MPEPSELDAERWEQLADAFEHAIALPPSERESFIVQRFANDTGAQRELREVLASHDASRPLGIEGWMLRDSRADEGRLPAGARVGPYRIDECVGEGGMGEVYRGQRVDGTFEQAVAIKVLRAGLGSAELVRRFQTERRILARLTHPGIVGILDGGSTTDGRPYLVMPYVEGQPITTYCQTARLTLEQRLSLFRQVALAVQHAHTALVVHRDIKPSNIFVTPSGEVRLLDFGIAKVLAAPDDHTDPQSSPDGLTRSSLRLLTPEHAAPEQVRGDAIGTATDVYGLGVLLYELLTGSKPHLLRGRSMRELEQEILDVEPAAPSTAASGVPWSRRLRGDLDRIVLMALRKEPARRYASVGQFADDIERYLKGMPVSAERDRMGYRLRKFVQRNRLGVGAGTTVALLLVALAGSMTWQARQLANERDHVQREKDATESVVQLLTSLFARANPTIVPGGDTLRVQQLLAAGDTLVNSLAGQPYLQARMWRVLGSVDLARGRTEDAERTLRRAYEGFLRIDGADSLEVAQTFHELARAVDGHSGRMQSLPMFEESVRRLKRAPGAPVKDIAIAERELAERALDRDAARKVLERAASAKPLKTADDSMEHAAGLNALANERYSTGRLKEALALFEETVQLLDKLLPAGHPTTLLVRGNLATMHRDLGNLEIAEAMSRELLAAQRAQVTPSPLAEAAAVERAAGVQALRGYLENAERGYEEALLIERASLEPAHAMIVWNRYSQAVVRGARGRARQAIATLDSVHAMMRRGGFSEIDSLSVMDLRAAYWLELERFGEAAAELGHTARKLDATLPSSHPARETHAQLEAILSLAQRRYSEALKWFDAARASQRGRIPDTHPESAGNECGRGIALAKLGRTTEAVPLLRAQCARYRGYGLHMRLLARWAAEVGAETATAGTDTAGTANGTRFSGGRN